MTAVANYRPQSNAFDSPFSLAAPRPRRYVSEGDNGRTHTSNSSSSNNAGLKRHSSVLPSTSLSADMDRNVRSGGERGGQTSTSNSSTWLRRLSRSVSTSRESSRTPSRPSSAAFSTANGSVAVSYAGSTTPMFSNSTPSSLPPNKLVKRPASSTYGSPSPGSGSRLPIPTFRRPATSHQRSATLQEQSFKTGQNGRMSLDGVGLDARDPSWRHYFTPRITPERIPSSRRRSSTGIPNPIKRVYPDRKYTPTLVSAKELVTPAIVQLDEDSCDHEEDVAGAEYPVATSSASSPFPPHTAHFEESSIPRRSFSIGDLLSTGPQPLWRRPSSRGKPWLAKPSRKLRSRGVSEPQPAMGNSSSAAHELDSGRPTKRRDMTEPSASLRSIYSSSSSSYVAPHPDTRQEIDLSLGSEDRFLQFTPDRSVFVEQHEVARTPSPSEQHRLPSATFSSSSARPLRLSAAQSEITSTTIDSDSEYRSVGDNSTDYQSDTAFDSIQTRTTRSSLGRRGPHIETIFDESPPTFSSGRSTKLRDFLSDGHYPGDDHNVRYRHSTIEEEGSVVSTPVRSIHNKSVTSTPSARPTPLQLFSSSPPAMVMPDPDEINWDDDDANSPDAGLGIRQPSLSSSDGTPMQPNLSFRFGPSLRPNNPRSANSTPLRNGLSPMDKTNLFDWSEQQPSPSHPNNSPPRPRTVHGKKDQDSRGSRPTGRRPASGMHARSHSVPVVPDLDGKRDNVIANKFGTWGVGSKAVTEDWNEDFDFDEPSLPTYHNADQDEKRIDSGHEMFVPRSIREQQKNVVANIGLLREWGLLIEELKELRVRAVALDMLNGQYAQAWREVDAMIELADQESEEQTLEPRRSPPSSPGFDYSLFEDTLSKSDGGIPRHTFDLPDTVPFQLEESLLSSRTGGPPSTTLVTRPRKDSELVAQSVIAALQTREMAESTSNKKVPFDTATLRHIVPYVGALKNRVKSALRETEGLYSSPHRRRSPKNREYLEQQQQDEPTVVQDVFNNGSQLNNLPFRQRSRRGEAETDNDEPSEKVL